MTPRILLVATLIAVGGCESDMPATGPDAEYQEWIDELLDIVCELEDTCTEVTEAGCRDALEDAWRENPICQEGFDPRVVPICRNEFLVWSANPDCSLNSWGSVASTCESTLGCR